MIIFTGKSAFEAGGWEAIEGMVLMNITLKGVEVGRYRIRKKIGIPSAKSLTEFMICFSYCFSNSEEIILNEIECTYG